MNPVEITRAANERLGATIRTASTLISDRVLEHPRTFGDPVGGIDRVSTGWADVDVVLGGGLLRGGLHEWFGVATEAVDDPSASGQGGSDFSQWFAPVCILAHLAGRMIAERQIAEQANAGQAIGGSASRWVIWVGRRCFAHPAVLVDHQRADRRLLERSLFVHAEGVKDRLCAIDLALRSPAIGAVVADGSRLDMAATRRIQLLAKTHQTPALLARPAREQSELSAAQSRWLVCWRSDARHRTGCDPQPQWNVQLLRCKATPIASGSRNWMVEWDHATSAVCLSTALADSADQTTAATGEGKRPVIHRQSA